MPSQAHSSRKLFPSHILTWQPVSYAADKVVLEIATATPYDVDLDDDGDVDGQDLLLIQQTDPALIPAWQFEYGSGSPLRASRAVPEPGNLVFVSMVLTLVSLQRASLQFHIRGTG